VLIVAVMAWVLPLFPGEPKLGPIAHRVDRFVPLPFPLLLVVPAFALDLIRNFIGAGRRWWRDVLIVVLSAVAFVALFSVTQWYFSKFLLSEHGQNWFFAADRHWGYTESLSDWRTKFWDSKTSRNEPTATLSAFAVSLAYALAASAVGLALGNWMAKVRR
jgi:prepilin signal peptidase PulO-like enzyme (type II secretory pathway)